MPSPQDIVANSQVSPSKLIYNLKRIKNDPFTADRNFTWSQWSGFMSCFPLVWVGTWQSVHFQWDNSSFSEIDHFSKSMLTQSLHHILSRAGLNCSRHSYGGVTTFTPIIVIIKVYAQ